MVPVWYFIILFWPIRNQHLNNCENIVAIFCINIFLLLYKQVQRMILPKKKKKKNKEKKASGNWTTLKPKHSITITTYKYLKEEKLKWARKLVWMVICLKKDGYLLWNCGFMLTKGQKYCRNVSALYQVLFCFVLLNCDFLLF